MPVYTTSQIFINNRHINQLWPADAIWWHRSITSPHRWVNKSSEISERKIDESLCIKICYDLYPMAFGYCLSSCVLLIQARIIKFGKHLGLGCSNPKSFRIFVETSIGIKYWYNPLTLLNILCNNGCSVIYKISLLAYENYEDSI